MNVLEVILWVVVLAASVVGIALKDWRLLGLALGCSVLAIVLMVVHVWR